MSKINVTVWNEAFHERTHELVPRIYPEGIHGTIAAALRRDEELEVRTATLYDDEHGLTDDVLESTDVLVWWGHMKHGDVSDAVVDKVIRRVWDGMGFIPLHSAHFSKPFRRLMGTECFLQWRVDNKKEILWVTAPGHPIIEGIDQKIVLEQTEMYGEWFQIPTPDEQIFISWFEGGEVFRSGCTWTRGAGRIFYFRPGHETLPIFHHPDIQRVIRNAVHWAAQRRN